MCFLIFEDVVRGGGGAGDGASWRQGGDGGGAK